MSERTNPTRDRYPPGTRIKLINMDDPHDPVPTGTMGTVDYVDDGEHIHMIWDNGRTLSLIPGRDLFNKVVEPIVAKKHIADFGDDCQIVLPNSPVDCSRLGFFDGLEEDCWELVKQYCGALGIEMIPDDDGEISISFDIAKSVQDTILEKIQEAGVVLNFENDISESEDVTQAFGM